jgi:hypothetical protein
MDTVFVPFEADNDKNEALAAKLLGKAAEADLPASTVRVTIDGYMVPKSFVEAPKKAPAKAAAKAKSDD